MERVNAFIVWWPELKTVQKLNQELMPPLHATAAFGACVETRAGNKQNKRESESFRIKPFKLRISAPPSQIKVILVVFPIRKRWLILTLFSVMDSNFKHDSFEYINLEGENVGATMRVRHRSTKANSGYRQHHFNLKELSLEI
ncbi:hypothetical protein glysoja_016485 [Glycine soja]|nr:hypothetical protein glysoja_016485 [Glycine soja]